jgi:RNA polymerase sigma-70 factor, ECF subfamily
MKGYSEIGDAELFYMLKADKEIASQAFEELYARYSPRVFAYCRRVLGNQEAAQDVFQDAFAKFFECAKDDRIMTNVPAFLLRITRNLCVNMKRKERPQVSFDEYMFTATNDNRLEKDELLDLIKNALELLTDDLREVFVLREYDGMSYKDIADITNQPLSTVKVRIFRAKQKIREVLAPYLADISKI